MKEVNKELYNIKESIFSTISRMARENNAINLAQGFPDFDGPEWITQKCADYIKDGHNQYTQASGHAKLRDAISKYNKSFYNLDYDQDEVLVTNGATEGIYTSLASLLNPGDEVILFEPFYDSYEATIRLLGAIPKPITLKFPDFNFSIDELNNLVTEKTKVLILNSPHNPSGKVFNEDELKQIAKVCLKNDLYCISDEVYEFLTFDHTKHTPIASFDGMRERTIRISSCAKTFGLTGWKVGWCCSDKEIIKHITNYHQFNSYCLPAFTQMAVADALLALEDYIPSYEETYQKKRDLIINFFEESNIDYYKSMGTYFICFKTPKNSTEYCKKLLLQKKVATIPPAPFYMNSDDGLKYLRVCFAKKDETLNQAISNFKI